jgi:hypothetical protein
VNWTETAGWRRRRPCEPGMRVYRLASQWTHSTILRRMSSFRAGCATAPLGGRAMSPHAARPRPPDERCARALTAGAREWRPPESTPARPLRSLRWRVVGE